MSNLESIQRIGGRLHRLCSIFLYLVPVGCVVYWSTLNMVDWAPPEALNGMGGKPYPPSTLFAGFMSSLLPCAVMVFGVWQLRGLFQLYERGEVFTHGNCDYLRRMSYALLMWPVVSMAFDALLSFATTIGNPPGERYVSIGFHLPELTLFILGGVFVVIARVMTAGCELAEDQAQIV